MPSVFMGKYWRENSCYVMNYQGLFICAGQVLSAVTASRKPCCAGTAPSPCPAPARAHCCCSRRGDSQTDHLCPPWLLPSLAWLQRAFLTPYHGGWNSSLNKTQPQTYSKHLLVFKENNSVKGTELCLKPYAFSFFTSLFGCKSYMR